MSKEPISKIYLILEKIDQIIENSESITSALEDVVINKES